MLLCRLVNLTGMYTCMYIPNYQRRELVALEQCYMGVIKIHCTHTSSMTA